MSAKAVRKNTERDVVTKAETTLQVAQDNDTTIVAIGASAGGIEALTDLMTHLPCDTGMAFVLVQHLDPKHHSILTELLARKTAIIVTEVTDGLAVKPNHVYVIPPNAMMSISGQTLHLSPREEPRGTHMSVDHFMRALAEHKGNRAIGVILSGSGTDGTLGMVGNSGARRNYFCAGRILCRSMTACREALLLRAMWTMFFRPKESPRNLRGSRVILMYFAILMPHGSEVAQDASAGLSTIFQVLRRATGVDFTHYRQTTILRRIHRRMVVHKIDKLEEYVKFALGHPGEVKALYQDMLINVTSFFRDPRVFDALKSHVFPDVPENLSPDRRIRIWTPGCASGEETYSLAILLLEFLGDKAGQFPVQLFGTDVSDPSISKARAGVYPENIHGDVSAERLRRFFTKGETAIGSARAFGICVFSRSTIL